MADMKERQAELNENGVKINSENLISARETSPQVSPELKTWLRKVEEDPGMANPIPRANDQQVMQSNQTPKVQLTVTRSTFLNGFKQKMDNAGKWLSTFILRLIKIKEGRVKFKEEE